MHAIHIELTDFVVIIVTMEFTTAFRPVAVNLIVSGIFPRLTGGIIIIFRIKLLVKIRILIGNVTGLTTSTFSGTPSKRSSANSSVAF